MKPISAYVGHPKEIAEEHRAWWPMRTASKKRIWPGQKYVLVKRFFDENGRPPMKGLSWDRIYTPKEYTLYLLTKDSKKKIEHTGSEFTGQIHRSVPGWTSDSNE